MGMYEIVCGPIIPGALQTFPSYFGVLGFGWIGLTMAAMLVSLLILALVYVFANFLRNQPLMTWTKFELFQVIGTAVIFAFTAMLVIGMCSFDVSFLAPDRYGGMNMFEIVDNYLASLQKVGGLIFLYLMYVVKLINLLAKITWLSNPLSMGMQDSPLESLGQINSIFFFVVGGFFTSLLLLVLQMKVVNYMAYASLYFLFPFGIFFRAFEPTRKFGGTLIGLCITFLLFYPMMLVFNDFIMYAPIEGDGVNPGISGDLTAALGNANDYISTDAMNPEGFPNEEPSLDFSDYASGGTPTDVEAISEGVSNGAIFILKPVMFYMIAAVLLPVINFIVLVEVARSFTHLLGEEVDVSNLTRMI